MHELKSKITKFKQFSGKENQVQEPTQIQKPVTDEKKEKEDKEKEKAVLNLKARLEQIKQGSSASNVQQQYNNNKILFYLQDFQLSQKAFDF